MKIYCICVEYTCIQIVFAVKLRRKNLNNHFSGGAAHLGLKYRVTHKFQETRKQFQNNKKNHFRHFSYRKGEELMNREIFYSNYLRTNISIPLILVCIFGFAASACAEGKDLSRAKAQNLITQSLDFKQPATLFLISPVEREPFGLDKINDSEKSEDAKARNLQRFLSYYPQIAVAVQLGLAAVDQQLLREEKAVGLQVPAQWFFSVKARANDQGKAMWKEYGMPASDDSIPLSRKEIVNITGITSLVENQAQADFTWKWDMNKMALALQQGTDEFKALPIDIQKGLLGQTEGNRKPQTEDWSGERQGKALFQRYDDGWRLMKIMNY